MEGSHVRLALLIGLDGSISVQSASNEVPAQLGYTPEEFLTSKVNFNHLVHPGDSKIAATLFSPHIHSPSTNFLIRLRHADGHIRIFQCKLSKEPASLPGSTAAIIELTDVRGIPTSGDSIILSSFKSLIAHTNDYIHIKNRNHVILAASRQLAKFTVSFTHSNDLVGKTDYDLLSESHADAEYALEEQAFAEGRRINLVQQISDQAGKQYWVDDRKYPINGPDGEMIGIFGIAPDITRAIENERRVRQSEALLHLFIEHAPAALAMFDREMRYLAVSRRWAEDHSVDARDLIGRLHYEVNPEVSERWKEAHRRGLAGEEQRVNEDRYAHVDGTVEWIRWQITPWRADDGSVGGIVMFYEDITERIESEKSLRLAASVFTHAREGITITDAEGTILDVNESFTRITGYLRDEVVGGNPRILNSGLQSREFYRQMWQSLLDEGHWSGEIWNRAKNGNIFAEHLTINAVCDPAGKVLQYVAHFNDITALKEHEIQLERMAHYDGLTGLPNRILLADRLRQAMSQAHRRQQKIAVAYLDIDGFKDINSQYGHTAGDTLLITLGARFKAALREGDTLARLGGDEFVAVILDIESIEAGELTLNSLLTAAAEDVRVDDKLINVTVSMGVTFYPQMEEIGEDGLIRQADQVMYQAKLGGRNCYRKYDASQDLTIRGRYEGREQIRRALSEREFVLYYQPKVDMRTGKVTGAEALIRWQHPERGLMAPASFLPIIEDHPLAIELGEWVIDTALLQIETWLKVDLEIPVSVNVGAMQLQQADFVDRLSALLAAHPRVGPGQLEIEIIETSALSDMLKASQVLNACHKIGVSIALDDFGTGYSSLVYLKRLPANVLKIDQSFVLEMFEDPENLTILEGVLGLASAFRLNVIAEGVESFDHGLVLLQLGCEIAQGYGIARPMPGDEFPRWVAEWRPDPRWAHVKQLKPAGREMLFASVEHRAWVIAIEAYLQGKRNFPPPLDINQCRFSSWLNEESRKLIVPLPAFEATRHLHSQLHELVSKICTLNAHDHSSALSQLPLLHDLRDRLLDQIDHFERYRNSGPSQKTSAE
jgi:diguanylate cyclase (GGDEF)-like protein/PAS domain S-box-containing protein